MKKLQNILGYLNVGYVLGVITDLYLLILILSNLYLLTQADRLLSVAKYGVSTTLAIIFAVLLHFLGDFKKKDNQ
jgi:predicted membrane channel-forming protein YqfA (hemolysin III family)